MKFVKFGKHYINFDTVCEVSIGRDSASIYFALSTGSFDAGEGKIDQEHIELRGSDVIALEQWINDHSDDARAPMAITEEV